MKLDGESGPDQTRSIGKTKLAVHLVRAIYLFIYYSFLLFFFLVFTSPAYLFL